MKHKPKLSFWQIWNMNFGFLGIQFGYALQNANVSRIFETLGADIENIPILWIAAPVTGLIVQPIIGHYSDNTWGWLGRRRPYFLFGAIFASLALLIMPNSPTLWVAAGMLWIMDASINISQEPFRAFVGDLLPEEQRTSGFTMQSFFIGIGAVIASALPWVMTNWFGISNTAPEGVIPNSVKFAFYFGAVAFFAAVAWTVFSTKEYSPEQIKEFEAAEEAEKQKKDNIEEIETSESVSLDTLKSKARKLGWILTAIGVLTTLLVYIQGYMADLYILTVGVLAFGLFELIALAMQKTKKSKAGLAEIVNDFNMMPKTMKQLAIVQFFSWFALFAMWIYSVAGITSHTYDMKMDSAVVQELQQGLNKVSGENNTARYENAEEILKELDKYATKLQDQEHVVASMKVAKFFADEERATEMALSESAMNTIHRIQEEYNSGADWVGVGFAVYNGFAAVFAFLLVFLAKRINRKNTHMLALVVGGISMIMLFFIDRTDWMLLIPFVGIGLTWASILAMPYAILTSALPANKMGVYMGIFNFFIVIPQILAASILGFLVKSIFSEEPIYALVLGGATWFLAAALMPFVQDRKED